MTFQSPSLSARKGLTAVGSQAVIFTQALHERGHTFTANGNTAGCVIVAEPALSAARALAMNALAESRSVLFTHPGAMAACGRELTAIATAQRLFIGTEAALMGHVPVTPWLQGQTAPALTGFFGGGADATLTRMTQRAEDAVIAESQLRLSGIDMEDMSGKATLARSQLLHGLRYGYISQPSLNRTMADNVSPEDIIRLRRWGLMLRYGFTLSAGTINVGPVAFAAQSPLASWQGAALAEASDSPASLLLAQNTDARAVQLSGLLSDLTRWQQGAINRSANTAHVQAATPQNYYLRAANSQRAHLMTLGTLVAEHPDTSGTWQGVIQTSNPQPLFQTESLCLPVLAAPTAEAPTLRLVA